MKRSKEERNRELRVSGIWGHSGYGDEGLLVKWEGARGAKLVGRGKEGCEGSLSEYGPPGRGGSPRL